MRRHWLIEQRSGEVWAWSLEESLFLRLGCAGTGIIFDLNSGEQAKRVGEFRWRTQSCSLDLVQSKPQLWVELLEAQLADSDSDLSLALRFNSTPPEERAWQFICLRNGSRTLFEFCVRSFFIQDEEVASFLEGQGGKLLRSNFQPQVRFQLETETPSWGCSLFHFYSGSTNFPVLKARFNTLLNFFDLKRDLEEVGRRRPLTDSRPAIWEMHAPLQFSVQLEPRAVSAHEKLENMWTLRERLALESSPEKDSLLQAILPSR